MAEKSGNRRYSPYKGSLNNTLITITDRQGNKISFIVSPSVWIQGSKNQPLLLRVRQLKDATAKAMDA